MWAKVYSWDGTIADTGKFVLAEITTGITFAVMMADSSATLETIYVYDSDAYTSLANPVPPCDELPQTLLRFSPVLLGMPLQTLPS